MRRAGCRMSQTGPETEENHALREQRQVEVDIGNTQGRFRPCRVLR